jgi:hypothetical protein
MCVLVLLMSFPLQAEEAGADLDLFEFLADWEADDGQWVEPSSLDYELASMEDEDEN